MQEIIARAENKNLVVGDIEFGKLELKIDDETIEVTGEFFLLPILHNILRIYSEDSPYIFWTWYFIEEDYVKEDPTVQFDIFFICYGEKIINEHMALSGLPPGFLKQKTDYCYDSDFEREKALTRSCYERFFKETFYGRMIVNRIRNRRDEELFKTIRPGIDDYDLLSNKIDRIVNRLERFEFLVIIGMLIIIAILIFKK